MKKYFLGLLLAFWGCSLFGQVLSWTPLKPTMDDTLTITYRADLGNGVLNGVSPIFAHTGVITTESTNPGDWKHIPVQWDQGPDSLIQLTQLGANLFRFKVHIRSFYGLGTGEKATEVAFVFRNGAGTLAGKNADNSDFLISLYDGPGYDARFVRPVDRPLVVTPGAVIPVRVAATGSGLMRLYRDGIQLSQVIGDSLSYDITTSTLGKFYLTLAADFGATQATDTLYYIVQPPVTVANPPAGTGNGITYTSSTSVRLTLLAPNKQFVYVIGDFNDWELDPNYLMNKSTDGNRHWIDIAGLTPGQEYRFQYWVDKDIKIADPWADKLLDPGSDNGISNTTYPNLIDYPFGLTTEVVSVLETGQTPYNWQYANSFNRPDSRDLVIYELLIRDFVLRHDYKTVKDSLDYLERLGVNCIELMPVMEFDGNRGWGYSPNFFLAPDKYYGTREDLKALVDECHRRGIAVVLDVVFNHTFGLSPLVRLYQDKVTYKTRPDNPWYNVDIPHPYGLGHDLNHGSTYTQALVDTVLSYWVNEYKVDGFRLDLSKGFTNNFTGSDIGAWSAYDAARVGYLKRMADVFWARHPGRYLILEHFADNSEEVELANYGFMMWGKASDPYNQCSMGWSTGSDFQYQVSYQARGWAFHNLVAFAESHDEERMMYRNIQFGNQISGYSTRDTATALIRMGQLAAFLLTVPGPKMMWQFQELGYDYTIEFNGRTGTKPIRWDYWNDARRQRLYKIFAAIIKLKTQYPAFRSNSYDITGGSNYTKQIHVNDASMNVTVIGNFDVVSQNTWTGFQHTGLWYNYLSGASLNVTDVNMMINLPPGEFRIFTDVPLPLPDLSVITGLEDMATAGPRVETFPNPMHDFGTLRFELATPAQVDLAIFDGMGRKVRTLQKGPMMAGSQQIDWNGKDDSGQSVSSGCYFWRMNVDGKVQNGNWVVVR